MDLASLCRREVVAVRADASLREAAATMCEEHVGSLLVVTDDNPPQVVGVVTDRDLALDVLGREALTNEQHVGDLVRGKPLAVASSAGLREAALAMEKAGVRRLLVVDEDGGVVGLVSADDLLQGLADDLATLARALRRGIDREKSERHVFKPAARAAAVYPAFGTLAAQ
jgi:CBS domain-containing protein